MFTEAEIKLIDDIELLPENIRYSKHSCVAMLKIRIKYDGVQPRECFCASVRRRIWYKDFMIWYEKALRSVH
jgi:hypothetical protein|tara:strand:- start:145 stop:360 length:216 start_codon:yes stop_codon:yes gene_type:complete